MVDLGRIQALEDLVIVCHGNEDYDNAVIYYNVIINMLSEKPHEEWVLDCLIKNYHCLGVLHRVHERFNLAEPCYQQAIEWSCTRHGEKHFKTIELQNYLAGLYFAQGKFEQAHYLLVSSLDLYKNKLGRDHQVVALTHYALALVKRKAFNLAPSGDFDDSHFKQAQSILNTDISKLTMDAPRDQVLGLIHLSMENYKQNRFDEAEELLRHGILLELNELWPKHPLVSDGFQLLADLYKSLGRFTQAERLYQKALDLRKEVLGENHLQVAASAFSLANLYMDMSRYADAEQFMAQCCNIRKSAGFPPLYAVSLKAYADVLVQLKRPDEAKVLQMQSEDILKNYGKK